MEKSIVKRNDIPEVVYTSDDGREIRLTFDTVKRYLVSGDATKVSDEEVVLFMKLCEAQKLNPFRKDVYLIKFGDEPASLVVSKDVFIRRAQKSGLCNGWRAGIVVRHSDGTVEYREGALLLDGEQLVGGWAEVYRKDWQVPLKVTVSISEYMKRKKDGQPTKNWLQMPATLIRKVALSQALRETFMEELQGLYSAEEMGADELEEAPMVQPAVITEPQYKIEETVPEEQSQPDQVKPSEQQVKPDKSEVEEQFKEEEKQEFIKIQVEDVNILRAKNGEEFLKVKANDKIFYAPANDRMVNVLTKGAVVDVKVEKKGGIDVITDFKVA